jgi:hypothetical protein
MEALSKISNIISQLKKKKEEDDEDVDISDLEIIFMKVLNVLKTGLEEEKARFATERMFQEEKDYEDEKRHEEFLSVLKQFVSMQPLEKVEEEEKSSGILNFFKNLIETLKNIFKAFLIPKLLKVFDTLKDIFKKTIEVVGKLIKKIGELMTRVLEHLKRVPWGNIFKSIGRVLLNLARFAGPVGLIIGAIVGLSYLLDTLVKKMPDLSLLGNYKEAESVLTNGTQRDIEYFANKIPKEYLSRLPTSPDITAKEKLQFFVQQAKSDTIKNLRQKKALGTITPEEQKELNELELNPNAPIVTETQLPNVPPRPPEAGSGARAREWDRKFGATHNRDGTPKVTTPAQTSPVRASSAGAGRGSASFEYDDFLARQLEEKGQTGAVFGVKPSEVTNTNTVTNATTNASTNERTLRRVPDQSAAETERLKRYGNKQSEVNVGSGRSARPKTFSEQLKEAQELGWPDSDRLPPHNWAPMGKPLGRGSFVDPSIMQTEPTARTVIADKGSIDTIPRPEEPKLAKSVQQPNVITNRFNTVNQENRTLELAKIMTTNQMGESGTVVNNIGKTEVIPDVPLSVEASQRDDTHTLSVVLSRYKRAYV